MQLLIPRSTGIWLGRTVGSVSALCLVVISFSQPIQIAQPTAPTVQSVLREAAEIALKQGASTLTIAELQIHARDFDGALHTMRGASNAIPEAWDVVHLAEAMARDGKKDASFTVLRLIDPKGTQPIYARDRVQLQWVEHLIELGDIESARKSIGSIGDNPMRSHGLRSLAVAYAKSGNRYSADAYFKKALATASKLDEEFDRSAELIEIANSQLTSGNQQAAKASAYQITEQITFRDSYYRVYVLSESAVIEAKVKDLASARELFRRALKEQKSVQKLNKLGALTHIAETQARAGLIDDALKTANSIKHDPKDPFVDFDREQALSSIATEQVNRGDAKGAIATALSVKYVTQYRDDALAKVVERQIQTKNLNAALATTERFDNPSRRTAALLRVIAAIARSGDRKLATETAARIHLTQDYGFAPSGRGPAFDYRLPQTWGVRYDQRSSFTMTSHSLTIKWAAEVASAAMELAEALEMKPPKPYAELFNDFTWPDIVRALARKQAALGDSHIALEWARQIGKGDKSASSASERPHSFAVEERISALVGVAEGMLDREKSGK